MTKFNQPTTSEEQCSMVVALQNITEERCSASVSLPGSPSAPLPGVFWHPADHGAPVLRTCLAPPTPWRSSAPHSFGSAMAPEHRCFILFERPTTMEHRCGGSVALPIWDGALLLRGCPALKKPSATLLRSAAAASQPGSCTAAQRIGPRLPTFRAARP